MPFYRISHRVSESRRTPPLEHLEPLELLEPLPVGYRIDPVAPTTSSTTPDVRAARLADIASSVGTPCYVYEAAVIRAAYATLDEAFDGYPHAIHYALKANSSLAVVRLLHSLGSHADANSLGEVDVALRCGFRPDQIVFTGVGKSAGEIERADSLGLLAINV